MARGRASDPEKEAARRAKISAARLKKMEEQGYINTPETRAKIGAARRGSKWTPEQREKIVGKLRARGKPKNFKEMQAKGHATPKPHGPDHHRWKGDAVGYNALHAWVRKQLGTPQLCEHCGTTTARKFEWANRSGKYRRDVSDWMRLCTSCHRKHDGVVPWNKGLKLK